TLLTLPEGDTIPAPGQAYAQFTSDTVVANELNLLQRGGATEVIRGNLLTLPVGGGLLYVQPVYVAATGGTNFPLLRKVLVSFGDNIAFEDTLDAALDSLFGGDSGADAGDEDVPVDPTPEDPGAEDPGAEDPGTGTPSGEVDEAALREALQDYRQALADRTAAYERNDLVGAAEADARMQEAIERAIAASGG